MDRKFAGASGIHFAQQNTPGPTREIGPFECTT